MKTLPAYKKWLAMLLVVCVLSLLAYAIHIQKMMTRWHFVELAEDGKVLEVERLIRSGTDVNTRGYADCSALDCAAWNGDTGMVTMLLSHGAEGQSAVQYAVIGGHTGIVRQLLKSGTTVKKQDAYLLCEAAEKDDLPMARLLIESGVGVNEVETEGETRGRSPLTAATETHSSKVRELLISKGAIIKSNEAEKPK